MGDGKERDPLRRIHGKRMDNTERRFRERQSPVHQDSNN